MREHLVATREGNTSSILVGRAMDDALAQVIGDDSRRRIVVLCQPTTLELAKRYVNQFASLGFTASGYNLPDGEEAKTMAVVEDVYRHLNQQAFTRDDLVVGVGGGALTDVAGFVAGTYLRGIPAVYVPTTLLGAVDAAIGGKTAVNVDGKNLAGVFKHPDGVVIDVETLDALPRDQRIDGAAEALKTGFIVDMDIVREYEANPATPDLEVVVNRSVAVKVSVVNEDFTEQGRRAILNYGHTVGHAIETSLGISHGRAVAIGMIAAGGASAHLLGFEGEDRQRDILRAVGLPIAAPEARRESVMALMALDKKRDRSGLRMVVLEAFGRPEIAPADDATVRCALDAIGVV